MEFEEKSSLFNLSLEPSVKSHLSETAKWAKFLAITGMIFIGLAAVAVLVFSYYMSTLYSSMSGYEGGSAYGAGFGMGVAIFYILLLAVWFFPLMYLLRFANRMRMALNGNDQEALQVSFQNLKVCFRFVGIVTIIIIALYLIAIVIGVISFAAFS